MTMQKATFGAGCFWHVQYEFSKTEGVTATTAGYMGGDETRFPHPSYKQVCSGTTGYIEVVEVEFDDTKISYDKLLDIFWNMHDPTTDDRQGPDVGKEYQSRIFTYNKDQQQRAENSKTKLQKKIGHVATRILPAATFFRAEEYHQDYIKKTGRKVCG